jgi:hypothetical protein
VTLPARPAVLDPPHGDTGVRAHASATLDSPASRAEIGRSTATPLDPWPSQHHKPMNPTFRHFAEALGPGFTAGGHGSNNPEQARPSSVADEAADDLDARSCPYLNGLRSSAALPYQDDADFRQPQSTDLVAGRPGTRAREVHPIRGPAGRRRATWSAKILGRAAPAERCPSDPPGPAVSQLGSGVQALVAAGNAAQEPYRRLAAAGGHASGELAGEGRAGQEQAGPRAAEAFGHEHPGSSSCVPCLIIRLVIRTIRRAPSRPDAIDGALNVSREDRLGPTGSTLIASLRIWRLRGSNPSRRAPNSPGQTVAARFACREEEVAEGHHETEGRRPVESPRQSLRTPPAFPVHRRKAASPLVEPLWGSGTAKLGGPSACAASAASEPALVAAQVVADGVRLRRDARADGREMDMGGMSEDAAGVRTEGARRCGTR